MARTSRLVGGVPNVGVGRPGRDGGARGVGRAPRAQWGLPVSKTARPREEADGKEQCPRLPLPLPCAVTGMRGAATIWAGFLDCPSSLLTRPTTWRTGPQ